MSLCCNETRKIIPFGEELRVIARDDLDQMWAVLDELTEKIPETERRSERAKTLEGGADVHAATSSQNARPFDDAYTLRDLRIGEFLFSVSRETLERYLPVTTDCITRAAPTAQ